MADVNLLKSIYTSTTVTAIGELAAADQAVVPGTAKIGSLAGFLFGTAGVVSAISTDNILPWLIHIDVFGPPGSNVGTVSRFVATDHIYNARVYLGGGEQNNEITWPVVLAAGTWTFFLLHFTGTSNGIYTVYLDAVSLGTIDGYANPGGPNNVNTITSISVSTTGKYTLKLKMATKNGSSAAYHAGLQGISFIRTA